MREMRGKQVGFHLLLQSVALANRKLEAIDRTEPYTPAAASSSQILSQAATGSVAAVMGRPMTR